MSKTTVKNEPVEALRVAIETLMNCMPPEASPDLPEALRGFMAAVDYKDNVLVQSRYEAMGAAFADTANRAIERASESVRRAREACQKVKSLNGPPGEQFDDLGKTCQIYFEKLLEALTAIKNSWVKVAQLCEHEVSRSAQLESLTDEVIALQASTMTGWPWTSLGLPPVNRQMISKSRSAYNRGEGKPINEWIDREAKHSSKG